MNLNYFNSTIHILSFLSLYHSNLPVRYGYLNGCVRYGEQQDIHISNFR